MSSDRERVAIASSELSAEVDPLGAQLFALRDGEGRDLLWSGDPAVWTGRAPILFPIIGLLNHGRYRLDGREYALPKHGFARHKLFTVAETSDHRAVFRLQEDGETVEAYPFAFRLEIAFAIEGAALTMQAGVHNPGEAPLPASFGFHPALRWPLPYGRPRAGHRLRFEQPEEAQVRRIDRGGLLRPQGEPSPVQGRDLVLEDHLFEDDALIFDRLESRSLCYGAPDGPQLEVRFPHTPVLGVWTKPGAGYICVEPWHGLPDPEGYSGDFRAKPGVFEVAPGDTRTLAMSITLLS